MLCYLGTSYVGLPLSFPDYTNSVLQLRHQVSFRIKLASEMDTQPR